MRSAFGVWRSTFGARGDWRGAALARAQGPRTFFPARGRPIVRVKQAAPANGPARCFVTGAVRTIHFAPRDKPGVSAVRGSRLLNKIRGHIRAEKNKAMSGEYDLKRLPSSQPERRTPNPERQTPNAERIP
jgi:hypothetical protein